MCLERRLPDQCLAVPRGRGINIGIFGIATTAAAGQKCRCQVRTKPLTRERILLQSQSEESALGCAQDQLPSSQECSASYLPQHPPSKSCACPAGRAVRTPSNSVATGVPGARLSMKSASYKEATHPGDPTTCLSRGAWPCSFIAWGSPAMWLPFTVPPWSAPPASQ